MSLKSGHRGYLQLSTEFKSPRWREALVVSVDDEWIHALVKCSQEESELSGLSTIQHDEAFFVLVEAQTHQLRLGVAGEHLKLDTDVGQLRKAGLGLIQSDTELIYATASDPEKRTARLKKKQQSSSGSGAVSSESGDPDDNVVLDRLKKSWLGGGIEDAEKKPKKSKKAEKSSKRFGLIEKKKTKSSGTGEKEAHAAMLKAAASSSDPIQGLLALQLAQSLKKEKSKRKSRKKSTSSSSDESSSADSSDESSSSVEKGEKGHSRAIYAYKKSGRNMFKHPLRYVRRFVRTVERELGAQDTHFRIVDYNKKIWFGKQRNLQRCHYLVAVILEMLLRQEPEKAALQTVLTLQAMHQAAIDGDWQVAWMLTHVEDPFQRKLWGGDAESLQHVTSYLKSMNELARSTDMIRRKGGGRGENEETHTDKDKKAKGKGKGKKDEKQAAAEN